MSIGYDVLAAAQRFSDAMAACEHWRVNDKYPNDKWKAAWAEQQAALQNMIVTAQRLPPKDPTQ